MFDAKPAPAGSKAEFYAELNQQLESLLSGEPDMIANLANASALLFHALPDLNWAGFYLLKDGQLVLGPFQGKPACARIDVGRGVCGTAAGERKTQLVADVHEFPGHIACDAASRSEIVVPLIKDGAVLGVLDVDAPITSRFDEDDKKGLEAFAAILLAGTGF